MKSLKTILGIALSVGGLGTAATVTGVSIAQADRAVVDSQVEATEVAGNLLFLDIGSIDWWSGDSAVTKAHMYNGNTGYTTWPGDVMTKINNSNLYFVHANSNAKNVIFTRIVGGNVVNRSSADNASKPLSLTNIGTKNTWKPKTDTSTWSEVEGNANAGTWNNTTWTWNVKGKTSGSATEDISIALSDYKYDDTPEFFSTSVSLTAGSTIKIKDSFSNEYGYSAMETDPISSKYFSEDNGSVKIEKSGTFEVYMKPADGKFWIQLNGVTGATYFAEQFNEQTHDICLGGDDGESSNHLDGLRDCWRDASTDGGNYSLAGTFNSWNEKDNTYKLKYAGKNDSNQDIYRISNLYLTGHVEFKVVVNNNWSQAYPASNYEINSANGYYCIEINNTTHQVNATKKLYVENLYSSLTKSAKDAFKAGTANATIIDAHARYVHIINRYGELNDFVGDVRSSSNFISPIKTSTNNGVIIIIIATVAIISISGAFFILRKKKHN